jgi:hypothetical protein
VVGLQAASDAMEIGEMECALSCDCDYDCDEVQYVCAWTGHMGFKLSHDNSSPFGREDL